MSGKKSDRSLIRSHEPYKIWAAEESIISTSTVWTPYPYFKTSRIGWFPL